MLVIVLLAPNDTVYKQWSCQDGTNCCANCVETSRPQQWVADLPFLCARRPCEPAGWLALLLIKLGDVETNQGPTTTHKQVWTCDICHNLGRQQHDSIVVQYVSFAQIRNVITSLKDSSPGWDHLSPFVMKQCVDTYVEPITVLISNSFYHGIFPDELKLINIFCSKIYERLIYNNVFNFMKEKEFIKKYQFSFRQKYTQ